MDKVVLVLVGEVLERSSLGLGEEEGREDTLEEKRAEGSKGQSKSFDKSNNDPNFCRLTVNMKRAKISRMCCGERGVARSEVVSLSHKARGSIPPTTDSASNP